MDLARTRARLVLALPQEAMVGHEAFVITFCISQESTGRAEKHFGLDTESEEGLFRGGKGNIPKLPLPPTVSCQGCFPQTLPRITSCPSAPARHEPRVAPWHSTACAH